MTDSRVKAPDMIWLQYCSDGSLGQFWWAAGDIKYNREGSADHCTPEERAVIEVVNKFYETPERPKPRFISHDCDTAHCTDRERDLLDALLARAKKGEDGNPKTNN